MHKLWVEEHRPTTLSEYVFKDKQQQIQIESWIKEGGIPHLLLFGGAGTGKTSIAKVLIHDLGVNDNDVLYINASRDNGVDMIRQKITNFSETMPWGKFKVILLDECLEENTIVICLRDGIEKEIKIKDLNIKTDLVKSFNVETNKHEWKSFELFDKGNRNDCLEIEFENGDICICTPEHKWYVNDNENIIIVNADQLYKYNHIVSPI